MKLQKHRWQSHGRWHSWILERKPIVDTLEGNEGVNVVLVLGDSSPSVLCSENGKLAVAPVL